MKILFVGQCTFRIELAPGAVLLTDPWFKMNRFWRAVPPACSPEELGPIHYLLSSHNHLDHIDRPSLELARAQGATVIGSRRVAKRARRFGIQEAVALSPGEEKSFGAFSVLATPAFHPLAADAIGFLIRAQGKQIYFCGDTRPDPRLISFLQAVGPIDLAFLQIACAVYFGKDDGLNLHTAAELAKAFSPRLAAPMHYHGRNKQADPREFADLLAGSGIAVKIFERGEEADILG